MRNCLAALALLAWFGCGGDPEVSPPDAPPPPMLPAGVTEFAGTDSALPADDLAPVFALVGDATYIGIGESVHTSGGYYAMKDRLIRAAIADHGLRLIAMETPRITAQPLETYLQTCTGTATDALRSVFPVFVDDHTVALFAWICQFNEAHPDDRVHFFGFDAQEAGNAASALEAWLTAAAPADAPPLIAALAPCHTRYNQDYGLHGEVLDYSDADFAACTTSLDALDAYIADNVAALTAATSVADEKLAEINAISLRSWQGEWHWYPRSASASYEARDLAMAKIFLAFHDLQYPGQRAIVWAHDYHLTEDHANVLDQTPWTQTFGSQLHTAVGAAYAPICLTGYDVSINWPGIGQGPLPEPDPGSVEAILHATGKPYLIADPKAAWLTPGEFYELTGAEQMFAIPADQYAALIYLETSPAMDSPYWGPPQ